MTEAIFGLIGVIVGGAITSGSEWLRERNRAKRELIVAMRLIGTDLASALGSIGLAAYGGVPGDPRAAAPLADEAVAANLRSPQFRERFAAGPWRAYATIVAGHVSYDEWDALSRAYQSLEDFHAHRDEAPDYYLARAAQEAIPRITRALRVVEPYARERGAQARFP